MAIGDLPSAELQLPGERRNGEDASKVRRRPGEAKARGWEWPSWQQQRLHLVNPSLVHQCRPRSPKVMTRATAIVIALMWLEGSFDPE